jgi:GDP-4-dehydro-6-deoxy-D-mannose reductase
MSDVAQMKVRRALVTGAEGFLGSHLVRVLRQAGVHVTGLARRPGPEAAYVAMGDAPWCPTRLASIIEGTEPDVVFHLVGGAVGSETELERLNLGVTTSLMLALKAAQVHPILICCGSAAEYGTAIIDGVPACESAICAPNSAYGAVKLAQTKAALAFAESSGTPVLIARIFNPIGPGMPPYLALGDFARQIAVLRSSPGVLQTGNLQVCRDFIDVEHVATTLCRLAHNAAARGVVNICSGQATRLSMLVDLLIQASGKMVTLETMPARVRRDELGVVVGDITRLASLGAAPPHTDYRASVARIWQDANARWGGTS